ncbi:uncharacterized protein BX664DRAFT_324597 [Halteromyces radiatus]|uniref:uncharacterized protein n=1 Tax=Halteromyces radiatus TaxID=101107 RepID=UPI00221FB3D9|nr:uncharacterized protein BX664DRAFT_324597 [Halteromyces radiatus]KAI8096681.1 hypothetical protein BX664DRAFT_324597 [Halteromyces radiatus]
MIFYKELLLILLLLLLLLLLCLSLIVQASSPSPQLVYQPNVPDYRFTNEEQSLFDKLAPESDLSIFLELLMHNDLIFSYVNSTTTDTTLHTSTLQHHGDPITVFCPTNKAFLDYWKIHPKKTWKRILERHIVPQTKLDAKGLKHASSLNTLLPGTTIHVKQLDSSWQQPLIILLDGDTLVDTSHPIVSRLSIAYKINHVLPIE